jgi:hypothetical protein
VDGGEKEHFAVDATAQNKTAPGAGEGRWGGIDHKTTFAAIS